jgi:hypothetical protein
MAYRHTDRSDTQTSQADSVRIDTDSSDDSDSELWDRVEKLVDKQPIGALTTPQLNYMCNAMETIISFLAHEITQNDHPEYLDEMEMIYQTIRNAKMEYEDRMRLPQFALQYVPKHDVADSYCCIMNDLFYTDHGGQAHSMLFRLINAMYQNHPEPTIYTRWVKQIVEPVCNELRYIIRNAKSNPEATGDKSMTLHGNGHAMMHHTDWRPALGQR